MIGGIVKPAPVLDSNSLPRVSGLEAACLSI